MLLLSCTVYGTIKLAELIIFIHLIVIPAHAGIPLTKQYRLFYEIPACAGMTVRQVCTQTSKKS